MVVKERKVGKGCEMARTLAGGALLAVSYVASVLAPRTDPYGSVLVYCCQTHFQAWPDVNTYSECPVCDDFGLLGPKAHSRGHLGSLLLAMYTECGTHIILRLSLF
jgi:hypothetical protein